MMVRDFHRVIGDEARAQILEAEGRLPEPYSLASAAEAMQSGCFIRFVADAAVRLIGVEAGGSGAELGPARGAFQRRISRRAARSEELPAAGRAWAGCR